MHAGVLPEGPVRDMLIGERPSLVAMMNALAADLHVADPLSIPAGHDDETVKRHTSAGCGLKFAYAQRLGESVLDAVKSVRAEFVRRLAGSLSHCDGKPDRPLREFPDRVYRFIPEDLQDKVTGDDFEAVKAFVGRDGWRGAVRDLAAGKRLSALTAVQSDIVLACRDFALSRYSCPVFNRVGPNGTDTHTVQLRADERTFIGHMNDAGGLFGEFNAAMKAAFAEGKDPFIWQMKLTALHGRGEFAIPVTVHRRVWEKVRRKKDADISSLMLEIGPDRVEVRVTVKHARTTPDVAAFSRKNRRRLKPENFEEAAALANAKRFIVARDVNLVNTLAHGVIRRDAPVTAGRLRAGTFLDKEGCREFLESHHHPGDNVVLTRHFSGRRFLDLVAGYAGTIDNLRRTIDNAYDRLAEARRCLARPLGLEDKAKIPEDATHPDPFVRHLIGAFFRQLDSIRKLKALRIGLYRKIGAIKKCWFGWVTNREVELAVEYDAVVVRENAGFAAIPKDDPKYRGRAFNRLMNDGCRGQVERMASGKLAWAGIQEIMVGSYWTSSTDIRHSVVDKEQRKGEAFVSRVDGRRWHADGHATEVIGNWLVLRPNGLAAT